MVDSKPHTSTQLSKPREFFVVRLTSKQPSNWKTILLHYLKPVGGKFILGCAFDVKKLPVKLPIFYQECRMLGGKARYCKQPHRW